MTKCGPIDRIKTCRRRYFQGRKNTFGGEVTDTDRRRGLGCGIDVI